MTQYREIEGWALVQKPDGEWRYEREVSEEYRGQTVGGTVTVEAERVSGEYGMQSILEGSRNAALRWWRAVADQGLGPIPDAGD